MTVNTVEDRITYTANGSTTQWTFSFPAVDAQFLHVFITDAVGNVVELPSNAFTLIMNPTIDPNPTSIGGKVIFPIAGPPLANGNKLTIIRELDPIQSVSLSNQSIIYPPVIEAEFDYLTMLFQRGFSDFSRAFRVGPSDPIPAIVPPVAQRANQGAFFDALGNLTPGQVPGGTVFISAAMQPVVGAATLPLARQLMGISPLPVTVNTTYVVTNGDDRVVLNLSGGFYSVTVAAPASFADNFSTFIFNSSTRGKLISISGMSSFILWPSQFMWLFKTSTGWDVTNPGRWHTGGAVNLYVNYALGNDTNDGLANGAQAFKTIQQAVNVAQSIMDGGLTINLDDGTHQVGAGVICNLPVLGTDGYTIIGNVSNPNNVIVRGDDGSSIFGAKDNAVLTLKGMQLVVNSGNCTGVRAALGAVVTLTGVNFGSVGPTGNHIYSQANATIFVNAPYHILSGAVAESHARAESSGTIVYDPGLCTMDGPVSIAYFVVVTFLGMMHSNAHVQNFGGGPNSGQSYLVTYNGVGTIGFASPPGSVGSVSTGGIWVS
jgi:hypothetical protein